MSDTTRLSTVTWERSDRLFLELGRLDRVPDGYQLSGTALYRGRGGPTGAEYRIVTDESWRTRHLSLVVDEPGGPAALDLRTDGSGEWTCDDQPLDLPIRCDNIDLAFTPATNTLAIRQLDLAVGASGVARIIWIQVPSFKRRAVEQRYTRLDEDTYRYQGRYGSYSLKTDPNGMVLDYPGGGWRAAVHRFSRHWTKTR